MWRKPVGSDPWQRQPWTPGSWGINDFSSPFFDFAGPTPGSWGINDGSPGCILGMTHGLHIETPEPKAAPLALSAPVPGTPIAPYVLTFKNADVPSTPDHSSSSPGGTSKSGADRAGYTKAILKKNITMEWDNAPVRPDGMVPFFAKAVNVIFALDPITVAVSSDYPVDSCPYKVTLKHEIEDHAKSYIKIFLSYKEILVKKLNAIPFPTERAPKLIKPKDIQALQDALGKQVQETVKTVADSLVADMDKDRRAKDSPEAYAAIYRQCPKADWEMGEEE